MHEDITGGKSEYPKSDGISELRSVFIGGVGGNVGLSGRVNDFRKDDCALRRPARRHDICDRVWVCPSSLPPVTSQSLWLRRLPGGTDGSRVPLEDLSLGRQDFRESLFQHLLFVKCLQPQIINTTTWRILGRPVLNSFSSKGIHPRHLS